MHTLEFISKSIILLYNDGKVNTMHDYDEAGRLERRNGKQRI